MKRLSISLSNYVYEMYLQGLNVNRSKFIEEMLIKGINSELGEYKGIQVKLIEANKELLNKELLINELKRDLELVKARVMTREKLEAQKIEKQRQKIQTDLIHQQVKDLLAEGDRQQ